MTRKRVHLHIGAHKTASTMIQKVVLLPNNLVRRQRSCVTFVSVHHICAGYREYRRPFTHLRNTDQSGTSAVRRGYPTHHQSPTEPISSSKLVFREQYDAHIVPTNRQWNSLESLR